MWLPKTDIRIAIRWHPAAQEERGTKPRALYFMRCSRTCISASVFWRPRVIAGRCQLPAPAAKYAKRSAVLRAGNAEHELSIPIASDAASYVRLKRGTLKGHRMGS